MESKVFRFVYNQKSIIVVATKLYSKSLAESNLLKRAGYRQPISGKGDILMSNISSGAIVSQYSPPQWAGPLWKMLNRAHKFLYEQFDELESGITIRLEER